MISGRDTCSVDARRLAVMAPLLSCICDQHIKWASS